MPADPLSLPLVETARDLREGRIGAPELVEAAIAQEVDQKRFCGEGGRSAGWGKRTI
jgi:hypothetical protein